MKKTGKAEPTLLTIISQNLTSGAIQPSPPRWLPPSLFTSHTCLFLVGSGSSSQAIRKHKDRRLAEVGVIQDVCTLIRCLASRNQSRSPPEVGIRNSIWVCEFETIHFVLASTPATSKNKLALAYKG
uniref:Uncharacterized protein n=1 Tax=Mesocestoides corti TaxID=53468 RepID=A0A5K3F5W0_MESCO